MREFAPLSRNLSSARDSCRFWIRFPTVTFQRNLDGEAANTATHLIGLLLSLAGAAAIVAAREHTDVGTAIACGVYATTLVIVYTVSTLSHAVQKPRAKHLLRVWDQGTIYLLIAGTYTPFVWAYTSSYFRWIVLAAIWAVALIGLCSKVCVEHRVIEFSALSYVLFGWVPALALINSVPLIAAAWMAAGGISYTLGTLFLGLDHKHRYLHATWHIFVIAASACHYYAIYVFILLQKPI